jgi:hypothetical protein
MLINFKRPEMHRSRGFLFAFPAAIRQAACSHHQGVSNSEFEVFFCSFSENNGTYNSGFYTIYSPAPLHIKTNNDIFRPLLVIIDLQLAMGYCRREFLIIVAALWRNQRFEIFILLKPEPFLNQILKFQFKFPLCFKF